MDSATALPSSLKKTGFLKKSASAMPTSFGLNSALDADFKSFELGNSFAEFFKNLVLKKSAKAVDFSYRELGKWFAEFALKIILPDFFFLSG